MWGTALRDLTVNMLLKPLDYLTSKAALIMGLHQRLPKQPAVALAPVPAGRSSKKFLVLLQNQQTERSAKDYWFQHRCTCHRSDTIACPSCLRLSA
jgi:hypothetical protein